MDVVGEMRATSAPSLRDAALGEAEKDILRKYVVTEDVSQKWCQALEEDVAAKKADRPVHVKNAQETQAQLESLMIRINQVLIAMGEGIAESKALQALVGIEGNQRQIARAWERYHKEEIERTIRSIMEQTKPK